MDYPLVIEGTLTKANGFIDAEKPDLVFVQQNLPGSSCEKIANRIRSVAGGEGTQVVLLFSDDYSAHHLTRHFDYFLDINLEPGELSRKVMLLLPSQEEQNRPRPMQRTFGEAATRQFRMRPEVRAQGEPTPPPWKGSRAGKYVSTRKASNGGEVAIYRPVPDKRILGFVMQLPNK